MSSSSQVSGSGLFLPGDARVVMGAGMAGPSEMTINEIEGNKKPVLDEQTELEFWARVRAKAQAKAQEILGQAMADAEAIRQKAREEGFAQGQADAQGAVLAAMNQMGQSLAGVLQGLEQSRPALWAGHREEFARLLKLGVEKTLRVELSERRREILGSLMEEAVELLDTRQGFTVVVHPDDQAAASQLMEEAKHSHPGLGAWRIRTDPALAAGGVRLESDGGLVDNTLDNRFEQVRALLDRLEFTEEA